MERISAIFLRTSSKRSAPLRVAAPQGPSAACAASEPARPDSAYALETRTRSGLRGTTWLPPHPPSESPGRDQRFRAWTRTASESGPAPFRLGSGPGPFRARERLGGTPPAGHAGFKTATFGSDAGLGKRPENPEARSGRHNSARAPVTRPLGTDRGPLLRPLPARGARRVPRAREQARESPDLAAAPRRGAAALCGGGSD